MSSVLNVPRSRLEQGSEESRNASLRVAPRVEGLWRGGTQGATLRTLSIKGQKGKESERKGTTDKVESIDRRIVKERISPLPFSLFLSVSLYFFHFASPTLRQFSRNRENVGQKVKQVKNGPCSRREQRKDKGKKKRKTAR